MALPINIEDLLNKNRIESDRIEFKKGLNPVTVEPDRISILSYSGPDRSISMQAIKEAKTLRSRRYRNRRLGEFLKELDLTEGRATGIPTIQKALAANGSKLATIETDEDRSFFLIDIPCHPDFVGDVQVNVQVDVQVELADIEKVIKKMSKLCPSCVQVMSKSDVEKLAICLLRCASAVSGRDMLNGIDTTSYKQKKRKYLNKLLEMRLIEMTKPDKPTARNQQYVCTDLGKQIIKK